MSCGVLLAARRTTSNRCRNWTRKLGLQSELPSRSHQFAPSGGPILHTLRLVTTHQGRHVPTVGGMLLFGRSRARHFPDGWIQAGRFRGVDKRRIVDVTEIRAHLIPAVEEAIAFVEHALHGADIGKVRRRERWSIPPIAVCARRW